MPTNLQTVRGPIASEALGVTLMHEHLLMSFLTWNHPPKTASRMSLRDAPVSLSILGELRMDPFVNLDEQEVGNQG